MNKTQNYQLNQWEADDRVLRTDFNADNAKIDAVLGTLARQQTAAADSALRLAVGQYTGTGSRYASLDLSQSLGKPVRLLVIVTSTTPRIMTWENPTSAIASWSSESSTRACNDSGVIYSYFALG